MEQQLDEDAAATKSTFYNHVAQVKEEFKSLLSDELYSE